MLQSARETAQFYAHALIQILIEPNLFFSRLNSRDSLGKVTGFLVIACSFFVAASLLTGTFTRPVWQSAILIFTGCAGLVLLSSLLGYIAMVFTAGKQTPFRTVYSVFVFSSGITLFVSWLPFLLWFTEPWKWWLVYTGFKNTCHITGKKAVLITVLTAGTQFLLLYSAGIALIGNEHA